MSILCRMSIFVIKYAEFVKYVCFVKYNKNAKSNFVFNFTISRHYLEYSSSTTKKKNIQMQEVSNPNYYNTLFIIIYI